MQPLFTIIVPTFNHAALLPLALESIAGQTIEAFEVFIIGDGASREVEAAALAFCQKDTRFTWKPFPKSPRTGEAYRNQILATEAQGTYVAYLSDDDLWHPEHLATMAEALKTSDFVGAKYVTFTTESEIRLTFNHISHPVDQAEITRGENFLPLSTVAHSLKSYLQLPHGWRSTPIGTATDLYMWQQWVAQPNIRFADADRYTVLNFPNPLRKDWSDEKRIKELEHWIEAFTRPEEWFELTENIVQELDRHIAEQTLLPDEEKLKGFVPLRKYLDLQDRYNRLKDARVIQAYIKLKRLFSSAEF